MLDQKTALAKLNELIRSTRIQRAYYDAFWALAKVYDHGSQWGYINRTSGAAELKFLRGITDPRRTDIRVAQNKIHPVVKRLEAAGAPEQIDFDLIARSSAEHGYSISAKRLLEKHLADIDALELLREKEEYRLVLGTVIIRRTLAMRGGKKIGEKAEIKDFKPGWAIVQPHEILRDPTANTLNPARDEWIFCHEKPQTAAWVKRNFGVEITPSTTMGQLMGYQKALQSATGLAADRGVTESKEPAVLVYECYYQDPDADTNWPWVLFSYSDQSQESGKQLVPLGTVRKNPFYGLPFHLYHYDTELQAPWGRGVPHVAMQGQDIFNISLTWLVRWMQEGSGRWMIPTGAITDKAQLDKALTNRIDIPLVYNVIGGAKPERAKAPELNPGAMTILNAAPTWIVEAVNLSDVQFGKPAGKRGESGQALEVRLGEANAPLEKSHRDDELTTAQLLYGTVVDLVNPRFTHLDRARKLMGDGVDDEQIRGLFRQSPTSTIESVRLHPSMVRPATRAEKMNKYVSLAQVQIIEPGDAQWEMMIHEIDVNTDMKNSFDKQLIEIEMMRSGQPEIVTLPEHHDMHIRTIKWYFSRPETLHISEEHHAAIMQHFAAHSQAKQTLAMYEGLIPQTPQQSQPSPPAQAGVNAGQAAGLAQPVGV